jgi:hypothetical protein
MEKETYTSSGRLARGARLRALEEAMAGRSRSTSMSEHYETLDDAAAKKVKNILEIDPDADIATVRKAIRALTSKK